MRRAGVRYIFCYMTNRFGVELHPKDVRWAAAEGVSQDVIAAVLLLHERSVDEIAPKLSARELEQTIVLVGRSPRLYARGTLEALESRATPRPPPAEIVHPNAVAREKAAPLNHARLKRRETSAHAVAGKPWGHPFRIRPRGPMEAARADKMRHESVNYRDGANRGHRPFRRKQPKTQPRLACVPRCAEITPRNGANSSFSHVHAVSRLNT
jgi:hypothetical protein